MITAYIDDEDGEAHPINRAFLAAWGINIRYFFEGTGWRLTEVDWKYRFVDGKDTDAMWVDTGLSKGAEVFFEATQKGGRHGSITMASGPCSGATTWPHRGIGQATLEGGERAETITCPSVFPPSVAAWAGGGTQWRLSGQMAGDSTLQDTRLFVLDFPKVFLR